MAGFFKTFEDKGGISLLKQWWKQGVLPVAVVELLMLGKQKKALELLRETLILKHIDKLRKQYAVVLQSLPTKIEKDHLANKHIWMLWWQGIENAPEIVKKCYESVKRNFSDWDITLLNENNWEEYVSLPSFIYDKFQKGIIPMAQFSDLIRLQLLVERGGMWMDSTIYVSEKSAPPRPIVDYLETELFMFQKEGGGFSNWLVLSKTNDEILVATRSLLFEYWHRNNTLTDYFIFHRFLALASEVYDKQTSEIAHYSNSVPHILLLHLFDEYDENFWHDLTKQTAIHKLSYKFDLQKTIIEGTYYEKLVKS